MEIPWCVCVCVCGTVGPYQVAVLSSLRHPNVVLFMGAVTIPPHYALVTELVCRGSLWNVLHSDTP
jgi:hypothetical protein